MTVLDLARYLSSMSTDMGSIDPRFWLEACDWDSTWAASKSREVNTLLALRGLANQFSTLKGKEKLVVHAGDILKRLASTHQWADIGARKIPFVTIALK